MGMDTHNPSGMLWIAMAMAKEAPTAGSSSVATKVARPSGKLWMPIARAVIMPMDSNLLSFVVSSALGGSSAAAGAPAAAAARLRSISSKTPSSSSQHGARSGAGSAMCLRGSDAWCAERFGSSQCTSASNPLMKPMPPKRAAVAIK